MLACGRYLLSVRGWVDLAVTSDLAMILQS